MTDADDRAAIGRFEAAFDELRDILHADGADLELESVAGDAVVLRLVLVEAGCEQCVMPQPHLERVALDLFEHAGAPVRVVSVLDPRQRADP